MDHVHIEEQIRPFKAKDLWHLLMTLREEKIARVLKIVECVYFCYRFLTINIMVVLMKNQKLNHGIYFLQRCLSVLFVIFWMLQAAQRTVGPMWQRCLSHSMPSTLAPKTTVSANLR